MSKWAQLEDDVMNWLENFADENISFRNKHQAIVGFPSNGFKSDGMLTDGNVLMAVEVETGQTHHDTNVGKYWLLYDQFKAYHAYHKIILFHVYTPLSRYPWRKKLGKFYASKMKSAGVPFEYRLMDYCSRKEDQFDTVVAVVAEVKTELEKAIRESFGQ